jgi:hypothetical protein
MLLATRHLIIRSAQEPPDTAGPPPPDEPEEGEESVDGEEDEEPEDGGAGLDCAAGGLDWAGGEACGTWSGLRRPRSPGLATAGSAGSDWEVGRAVAEPERGLVLDDLPCATSATNTAKPAVSAALEPITHRRM